MKYPVIVVLKKSRPHQKEEFEQLLLRLSPSRARQIRKVKDEQTACHMLAGSFLVQSLLWQLFQIEPSRQKFARTDTGKPFLEDFPDIHFNISHSGDYIAAAVSNQPVGVDIQQFPENYLRVARRMFSPEDVSEIVSSSNPQAAFTRKWSEMEAFVKLTGQGIGENTVIADNTVFWNCDFEDACLSVCQWMDEEE